MYQRQITPKINIAIYTGPQLLRTGIFVTEKDEKIF